MPGSSSGAVSFFSCKENPQRKHWHPQDPKGWREKPKTEVQSAELTMIPKTTVEVAEESSAKKLIRLIEALEDNDDVQEVSANFDIPEQVLEAVAG